VDPLIPLAEYSSAHEVPVHISSPHQCVAAFTPEYFEVVMRARDSNNVYHRGPGIRKYNAGVVPSVFLNVEMNELGVL
jgi:hypothetical protein